MADHRAFQGSSQEDRHRRKSFDYGWYSSDSSGNGKGKQKEVSLNDCVTTLATLKTDFPTDLKDLQTSAEEVYSFVRNSTLHKPIKDRLTELYKNVCFELRKHTYDRNSSPPPDPFSKAYEFFNDASTNIYEPYYQSRLEEVGLSQPPSDEQRPDELKKIVVPEDLDTYSQPILIDNKHLVHQDCYFFRPRQGFSKKASYTDGHNRDEIGFKKNQWIKATRNQKLCVVFEVTPGIYHFFRKVDVVAFARAHNINQMDLEDLLNGKNMFDPVGDFYNVTSGDIDRFKAAGIPIIKEQNVGSHERSSHQSQSLDLETSFRHLEISPSDNVPQTSPYDYYSSYQGTEGVIESQSAPYSEHFQIPSSSADAGPSWYAPIGYDQPPPFQPSPTHFSPTEDISQIPPSDDIPSTQYMGYQEKEHYEGEQHKERRKNRRDKKKR